jgi:membrane-associated phospholipid phosphatase
MSVAAEPLPSATRRCLENLRIAFALVLRPPRIRTKHPWLLPPKQLAIAAGITLGVLMLGMIFVDAQVSSRMPGLPHWLSSFFDTITDYGKSGWTLWPLGLLFLFLCSAPPVLTHVQQRVLAAIMVRIGFLFTAIAVPSLFDTIIKRLIGRARPNVTGHFDSYAFSPFIWRADYASLPSGHATTAFAILVAFSSICPGARTYFLVYALLIAISRVVLTAHYPTDVAAGALVGIVGALIVRRWFALRRLGFSIGPDGTPRPYPGPSRKRLKSIARALLAD